MHLSVLRFLPFSIVLDVHKFIPISRIVLMSVTQCNYSNILVTMILNKCNTALCRYFRQKKTGNILKISLRSVQTCYINMELAHKAQCECLPVHSIYQTQHYILCFVYAAEKPLRFYALSCYRFRGIGLCGS